MEIINCNDELKKSIIMSSPIIVDNKRIKAGRINDVSIMEYIMQNKNKITEDYYVLANKIYKDENGVSFAYEMDELSEYKTVDDMKDQINKYDVCLFVYKVLSELINIDVVYWDIHIRNVLVSGDSKKLIDIDDAFIGKSKLALLFQKQNYIEFLLNVYLNNIISSVRMHRYLTYYRNLLNAFSYDVGEYLLGVANKEDKYLDTFSLQLLEELNNENTIEHLKYELKKI